MTYTGASLILGVGKASAAQIDRFFEIRGRSLAPRYAPDKQYRPAPAGLGQMIIDAARLWRQSVNHDLLAAQIVKEAAAWQSEYSRHRNNPSGLGAINSDPDQAIHFATPQEGIRATVAHLLTYISGPGPWTEHDPRAAVTPASWQGSVRRLKDLEQKWAFTPWDKYNATPEHLRYGASIASIANDLLSVEVDDVAAQVEVFGVPVEWVPADDRHYTKGRTAKIKQIVHHHTDGWNSLAWLTTSPNSNVSAHFLVNHEGTKIWQLVRLEDTAHTQGNHNPWSVGIEWERKWPDQREVPETVYHTLAKLDVAIRAYCVQHDLGVFFLNRQHVKRHSEVNDTACPQNLDVDRIIATTLEYLDPPQPDETAREINGYTVRGAILAAYRQLEIDGAHWWTFGIPTGADVPGVLVDGIERTVQPFDRAGWVMTEGGGVVIAKPAQAKQINAALGIETGADVRVAAVREAARAARDQIDVILSEVAAT